MSTFNNWTIITLPSSPPPKSIEWDLGDIVGAAPSPFSYQQQIQSSDAAKMRASLSWARQSNADAMPLLVFLRQTQGIANIFLFGDPKRTAPQNPAAVGGAVSGSGQTGYTLLVTGSSDLTPGDYFSLGLRLYFVVSVDGGTLGIWPNLRESPTDGTDLVLVNPQGLFRLTKNQRKFIDDDALTVAPITFEIEEAL